MTLTNTLHRAPRWAWYVGGGVGLGALAIGVYQRRAQDIPAPEDTSNDAQVIGGRPGGSAAPSPVITPPVIIQPNSDGPDFTGMFAVFGDALNAAVGNVGQLAQGDQGLAITSVNTIGQLAGGAQEIARQAVANAGQAPASLATPVVVNVPTATTPAVVAKSAKCPAEFPKWNAAEGAPGKGSCYKCVKGTQKGYPFEHVYQDGHKRRATFC
jgi:hypothetical protein